MLRMKVRNSSAQILLCHFSSGDWNRNFKILTLITHIHRKFKAAAFFCHALTIQRFGALVNHVCKLFVEFWKIFYLSFQNQCTAHVEFCIGQKKSKAAERSRMWWNNDLADAKLLGHFACMQRSRAAKSHQAKFPHIVSFFNGNASHSSNHVGVYHGDDAVCCLRATES